VALYIKFPLFPNGTIDLLNKQNNSIITASKGCNLVVSKNAINGDLILWESRCGPLVAYDTNLNIIYNSALTGNNNDRTGQTTSHYNPLIVNGRVYVAQKSPSEILVYGSS